MPKTKYGKWSVGSIFVMFVLFAIIMILTNTLSDSEPTGETIYAYSIKSSIVEISLSLAITAGIGGFVMGLYNIISEKERCILVYTSTIIGAAFTFFYILRRLFPNSS